MNKKVYRLSIAVMLLLVLSLFAFGKTAKAEAKTGKVIKSGKCGNHVRYKLYENGKMVIYTTSSEWWEDMYNFNVREIKGVKYKMKDVMPWYKYRSKIKKVVVKRRVKSIGNYAFYGCKNLKSVKFSDVDDSLCNNIGDYAFYGCTGLKYAEIPHYESLGGGADIGKSAFEGCINLTDLKMSSNLDVIKDCAFKDCKSLTDIKMDFVSEMGNNVFEGCTNLTSVKIEVVFDMYNHIFKGCKNLTDVEILDVGEGGIGYLPFEGCTSLKTVKLPKEVSLREDTFADCTSLEEIDIPEEYIEEDYDAAELRDELFYNCKNLKRVRVHMKSLDVIHDRVFYGCEKLESITLYSSKAAYVAEHAFDGIPDGVIIYVPKGSAEVHKKSFEKAGIDMSKIKIREMEK